MIHLRTTVIVALAIVLAGCNGGGLHNEREAASDNGDAEWLGYSDGSDSHASLYDQGKTSACWIYAMCVCVEHEQLRKGDSVTLSRQWLLAREMEEQTRRLHAMHRQGVQQLMPVTDPREGFSLRGVGPEALRLMQAYGLVPHANERSHVTTEGAAIRRLTMTAQTAQTQAELKEGIERILPRFAVTDGSIGGNDEICDRAESSFYYYSMRYTARQFAESILYDQQWEFLASVDNHAWGEHFALETPDNYRLHEYLNVPIDTLVGRVMGSLRKGHAVYWEYGKPLPPTRRGSKRGGATSKHAMAITGLTHNKKTGEEMLVCRNSYGRKWGKRGCCAVTLDYFRKHTCNVGVIKDDR